MKTAILSNINADLHSFAALLSELATSHPMVNRLINLGDTIGAGSLPNQCLEIARFFSARYFNAETVDDRIVANNLKLGGINDPDQVIKILDYLKQGLIMHSLIGKQDLATFQRDLFFKTKQISLKNIKQDNLVHLLWHQHPGTDVFINRMLLKNKLFSEYHFNLEIRFAYGSWNNSYYDQIESYRQVANMLSDAGEQTLSFEKRIKDIQNLLNKNFAWMTHWRTIMFVGGCPDPLLFYKKEEQSQSWFIYEEPLLPYRSYTIEPKSNYIVTPGALGRGHEQTSHSPAFIILDLPEQAGSQPTFTLHTLHLDQKQDNEVPTFQPSDTDTTEDDFFETFDL
ncbi:hypothetical protein JXQ70_16440 [bacterium]|nr:hypothetical protein [bacterium]